MPIFELLTAVVLIVLFMGYLMLNKRRGGTLRPLPFKAVLVSMLSFSGSVLCSGIYNSISISGFQSMTKSLAAQLISEALILIAINILFYAFFAMIHTYGDRIMGRSNMWSRVRIVHWVLLGLFVSLSIVDWCWSINDVANRLQSSRPSYPDRYWIWTQIVASRWIIFWVGSWEVLGAFILLGIQMSTRTSHIRMTTFFAVISGSLFLGLNGLWAVWSINSYLASAVAPTTIAIAVREIVQFFFATGTYLGLGLCFWRFPTQGGIDQENSLSIKFAPLSRLVEADSRNAFPEIDASRPILEADVSRPVVEADATNPILEADSRTVCGRQ